MAKRLVVGPGSVRVGRFVGRLGVVSLPAVEVALDLDERVVRRHVAKLEDAGWLARAPWIWGDGSVVWLTRIGTESAGLGGLRPVKAPPATTTISHSVLVGWSAARLERRGRAWKSARELAIDPERWSVTTRCERGYTTQLPDLVAWVKPSTRPVAVIAESGGRREDRQKMILEGWRDAIWSGQYAAVRYDCASTSVAHWIARLAKKIGLERPRFTAVAQPTAEQIAALAAAEAKEPTGDESQPPADEVRAISGPNHTARPSVPSLPAPPQSDVPTSVSAPVAETAEAAAERDRRYREILGMDDEKPNADGAGEAELRYAPELASMGSRSELRGHARAGSQAAARENLPVTNMEAPAGSSRHRPCPFRQGDTGPPDRSPSERDRQRDARFARRAGRPTSATRYACDDEGRSGAGRTALAPSASDGRDPVVEPDSAPEMRACSESGAPGREAAGHRSSTTSSCGCEQQMSALPSAGGSTGSGL